ncbi:MAG: hypothetical protein OXB86_05780 [Bdellovibrionales bacterium]|nr:hypothetical protein [Bdellovibrionales bacterium]
MRFATERLSVASVSKPNSLLTPIDSQEGLIHVNRKFQNSNRIDYSCLNFQELYT